jgi:hypothetical protein
VLREASADQRRGALHAPLQLEKKRGRGANCDLTPVPLSCLTRNGS